MRPSWNRHTVGQMTRPTRVSREGVGATAGTGASGRGVAAPRPGSERVRAMTPGPFVFYTKPDSPAVFVPRKTSSQDKAGQVSSGTFDDESGNGSDEETRSCR